MPIGIRWASTMTPLTVTVKFSFENVRIDVCAFRTRRMQQFPKFIFCSTVVHPEYRSTDVRLWVHRLRTDLFHAHPWAYWRRGAVQKLQFLDSFLKLICEFKIKSLLYKDLILNSRGCLKSWLLLKHPHRFCLNQRHLCRFWDTQRISTASGCQWF